MHFSVICMYVHFICLFSRACTYTDRQTDTHTHVCVCVRVWERERGREDWSVGGFETKTFYNSLILLQRLRKTVKILSVYFRWSSGRLPLEKTWGITNTLICEYSMGCLAYVHRTLNFIGLFISSKAYIFKLRTPSHESHRRLRIWITRET
jgi:hypothetical protein